MENGQQSKGVNIVNKSITIDVKATVKNQRVRSIRFWIGIRLMIVASWLMKTEIELELEEHEKSA